ncbi:MAG: biotin--[acetyl-CoA-carboxylase] ligase [Deltaproteobacteria bacterium]|nr:biotin--[acetyl-CoA-carboxylase] ligase [Deltaproteobacteria bacterium]MBW1960362.1 biotin--[acetyl-CoA-carboxylase] ligase [Deltaproteobacteria bacterium]MBW1993049.1 biotin--[acetyl-CoA-carboxylase] ligase [Deltaproteobacteria bacterium]MBW2151620.1 biotin--[acetyl-CoA-carboxylase] ligase [Deltaproteobacteria bacterium]
MVSIQSQILELLRSQQDILSGEFLSLKLGVSRVSIWKHIQKLKTAGYDIESSSKGYLLKGSPDIPYPWEFPERQGHIVYYPVVDSTMIVAKDMARKGCPNFTVVVADSQKQGRGRLNRIWISDPGGLYFTLVLRPKIPVAHSPRLSLLASMSLAELLREMIGIEAAVKWPNDILVNEYKLAGMLTEMEAETDRVQFVSIGIGINVNNDPSGIEPRATSLKRLTGETTSRKDLLRQFLNRFEQQLRQADLDHVASRWKSYSITINRKVRIVTSQNIFEGLAVDVDPDGALLLKMADGSIKRILYGDCFHINSSADKPLGSLFTQTYGIEKERS